MLGGVAGWLLRGHSVEHVTIDGIEAGGEPGLSLLAHEGNGTFRVRGPEIARHVVVPRHFALDDKAEGAAFPIVRGRHGGRRRDGGEVRRMEESALARDLDPTA